MKKTLDVTYRSALNKATVAVNGIKRKGLKIGERENRVQQIAKQVCEDIQRIKDEYGADKTLNTMFREEIFATIYQKAIIALDEISEDLIQEYMFYSPVYHGCECIKYYLKKNPSSYAEIEERADYIIWILQVLETPRVIERQKDAPLVKQLYQLVYEFEKMEVAFSPKRTLLNYIMEKEFHSKHLAVCLQEDMAENHLDIQTIESYQAKESWGAEASGQLSTLSEIYKVLKKDLPSVQKEKLLVLEDKKV